MQISSNSKKMLTNSSASFQNNIITNSQSLINPEKLRTEKFILDNIDNLIVIFANPISGNQEGKIFLNLSKNSLNKLGYRMIDFKEKDIKSKGKSTFYPMVVVMFNLIEKSEQESGIRLLKKCINKISTNITSPENQKAIKVLIAGGDGTVLGMIQTFQRKDLDLKFLIFGHIPLGTGNDLSNALGFSNTVDIDENYESLYKILVRYITAEYSKVDVWKIELILDEEKGKILKNSDDGKHELLDNDGNIMKVYERPFINYLSFGYDARVGFNFDSRRTSSRCCNKCVYFWEGLKKFSFRKTMSVPKFIESFSIIDSGTEDCEKSFITNLDEKISYKNEENIHVKYQLKSEKNMVENDKNKTNIVIDGNPCSIICQNINFYMAGIKDIWKNSDKLSAKIVNVHNEEKEKAYLQKFKIMVCEEQLLNDKKLEFFTFDNGLETGFEKITSGHAKKLYHGFGPVIIKFAKTEELNKDDKKNRIYMNIDGEYFNLVVPISLRIELDTSLCEGQVPFLIRKNQEDKR